jgi:hypothetical protein
MWSILDDGLVFNANVCRILSYIVYGGMNKRNILRLVFAYVQQCLYGMLGTVLITTLKKNSETYSILVFMI